MSARRRILPLFIPHLGCPNACVFCNQKRISGQKQPVTGADVSAALESLAADERGLELAFYGGSFTALHMDEQRELLGAAQPFRECGVISSIRVSTRPDAIDLPRLQLLRDMGCTTIELGAQSMCDDVLAQCGRGHTAEDTRMAAELIRQCGFCLILQMMTGLPGSSMQKDFQTAEMIRDLHPDGVRIYPSVILRDTEMYDMWQAGLYTEHTVEDAVACCAEILPIFQLANIPVIRLGLNPTDELSGGDAVGGAYHPAFGELVRSRILFHRACEMFDACDSGKDAVIAVCPRELSQMIGSQRSNICLLKDKFCLGSLKVVPDATLSPGVIKRIDELR